ncbi:MAG: amino acid ABC transporter permease, partial [Lachnospiraceae bacterium]|nr:amino acid ABC transporter permease [Lachnospiraceae bacterium]MBP5530277.1 amino acid ABC transporter permease [Lachnospiraceae bacterium]
QVLGMTKTQIFFKIILAQVIKRIIPPMGNEIITLVKDTSLARVVSCVELLKAAQDIVGLKAIIWPIFYIGAFYLLFTGVLTIVFGKIEKKLDYYKG